MMMTCKYLKAKKPEGREFGYSVGNY